MYSFQAVAEQLEAAMAAIEWRQQQRQGHWRCGSNSNSGLLSGMPEDQRSKRPTANPNPDEERLGSFREQSQVTAKVNIYYVSTIILLVLTVFTR